MSTRFARTLAITLLGLHVASCSNNSSDDPTTKQYAVSGTVAGLAGGAVTLVKDDVDTLAVSANGTFTFRLTAGSGASYSVSIAAEPADQVCTIVNAQGTIANQNVTNVNVSCVTSGEKPLYAFSGAADGSYPDSGLTEGLDGNLYGTTIRGGASDVGTVYRLTPDGRHTVIYSFTNGPADGQNPASGLELADDGTFYATTTAGGQYGQGTFFRITTAGQLTTLFSFGGPGIGAKPQGITLMQDGNFYGTTSYGGANNLGTVYRITPAGAHTVLYSFAPGGDARVPVAGLSPYAVDGMLYGVTHYGGANNLGAIFRIATDGAGYAVLHSFAGGTADGEYPGNKLRQAPDGYLYGTTGSGGAYGLGTVFKYSPATGQSLVRSFAGAPNDGSAPSSRLRLGEDGYLYGVTFYGGRFDYGSFFRLATTGEYRLLYSFSGGAGGQSPSSSLLTGSDGYFYGTTVTGGPSNNGTIYKILP